MAILNSLKQLKRTPVKALAFLILLILAVTFFMLGFQLWTGARDNIDRINKAYMTIGTVEQKANSVRTEKVWDGYTRSYTGYSIPDYGGMIPISVLDFEGANYIMKPEKRACYGAHMPGFVMSSMPYWDVVHDKGFCIAELQPLEDCVTDQPVCMKVKRVLCGGVKDYIDEIWFDGGWYENSFELYADKTYIMFLSDACNLEDRYVYEPGGGLFSYQRDKNGKKIVDPMTTQNEWGNMWDEVTEGFYDTPRGKAWLNLMESVEWGKYTVPVIATQKTKLLMPFFDGDARIIDGRDISREEYDSGEKVCLVEKNFAVNNNLTVGGSLQLPLYTADYQRPHWYIGWENINAKGEMYPVFEDNLYKIVGIFDTLTASLIEKSSYDLAENTVVIPSASVKNSDENNIVGMGPMKGYTTSFEIPNGKIDEFMAAWEKQGIPNLEINFYDHGYTKIKAGLDDMMNTASVLLSVGAVITLLILILFCHLFITKQRKRTAIERSLGMSKKGCIASLLTGILVIVIPTCVIGSVLSFWLSGYAAEQITAAHNEQAYDTMFSDWVHDADTDEESFTVSLDNGLKKSWAGIGVIPVALVIALINIRGNLKSEPLRLLGEKER